MGFLPSSSIFHTFSTERAVKSPIPSLPWYSCLVAFFKLLLVIVAFKPRGKILLTSNGVPSLDNSQVHFNKECIYPNHKKTEVFPCSVHSRNALIPAPLTLHETEHFHCHFCITATINQFLSDAKTYIKKTCLFYLTNV